MTLWVADLALPMATCSVLFVRYEVNQFWAESEMPMVECRRWRRMLWSMVSKAAVRSRRMRRDGGTSVCSHQEIIGDPDQGCFRAVAGAKTRLEFFEQIILFEMVLELGGNCFFYYFGNYMRQE